MIEMLQKDHSWACRVFLGAEHCVMNGMHKKFLILSVLFLFSNKVKSRMLLRRCVRQVKWNLCHMLHVLAVVLLEGSYHCS